MTKSIRRKRPFKAQRRRNDALIGLVQVEEPLLPNALLNVENSRVDDIIFVLWKGVVKRKNTNARYHRVIYDDGDFEDMSVKDIIKHLRHADDGTTLVGKAIRKHFQYRITYESDTEYVACCAGPDDTISVTKQVLKRGMSTVNAEEVTCLGPVYDVE